MLLPLAMGTGTGDAQGCRQQEGEDSSCTAAPRLALQLQQECCFVERKGSLRERATDAKLQAIVLRGELLLSSEVTFTCIVMTNLRFLID